MSACWPMQLPPTAKAVLISLADNANDHGVCWPAIATISKRTCFSERAVQNAIKWLESAGLVVADRTNGRHTTYKITPAGYSPPQDVRQPPQEIPRPPQEVPSNRKEPSRTVNSILPSATPKGGLAERLAKVTDEAIECFNSSSITKANGGNLSNVSVGVGRERRQAQVKRCLRVARQICEESTGSQRVTPEFWAAYFDLVAQDDFYAGRKAGGNGHENYVPDFELLTREATMLKIYDKMVGA